MTLEQKAVYDKAYNLANKEKRAAQKKAYYEANKDVAKASAKAWDAKNPEKAAACKKMYRMSERGRAVLNASHAKWKAKKVHANATPAWADMDAIMGIYAEARIRALEVDHVVPLEIATCMWASRRVQPATTHARREYKKRKQNMAGTVMNVTAMPGCKVSNGEPNEVLVCMLRDLLALAESGKLQSFIGAGFTSDGLRATLWCDHNLNVYETRGSLAWLESEYIHRHTEVLK